MTTEERKAILDSLIEQHEECLALEANLRERILAIRKVINEEIYGKSIGYKKDMPTSLKVLSNPYGI